MNKTLTMIVALAALIQVSTVQASETQCTLTKEHLKIVSQTETMRRKSSSLSLPILNYEMVKETIPVEGSGEWLAMDCEAKALEKTQELKPYEHLRWDFSGEAEVYNRYGYVNRKTDPNNPESKRVVFLGTDYVLCVSFLTDADGKPVEFTQMPTSQRVSVYPTFVDVEDAWDHCETHAKKVLAVKAKKYPDRSLKMHYFVDETGSYADSDDHVVTIK